MAVLEETPGPVPMVTSPVPVTPPVCDDVDVDDLGDPLQVALYASDIFRYYREREVR